MNAPFEGRLTVEDFGRQLVTTEDLDPVYSALSGTLLAPAALARWLVAYWCYYHVGVACYAAEQSVSGFWDVMRLAAANEQPTPIGTRWPRAAERRHFRGKFAMEAVRRLEQEHRDPYELVMHLAAHDTDGGKVLNPDARSHVTAAEVMRRVRGLYGFGDWIAFKVADMLERVGRVPVKFTEAEAMYETPTQGARLVWEAHHPGEEAEHGVYPGCSWALGHLAKQLADLRAAPRQDRPLGLQEYETILCKWKSHLGGHYPVGKDSLEVAHALQAWAPRSLLASRMHGVLLTHCPLARTASQTHETEH